MGNFRPNPILRIPDAPAKEVYLTPTYNPESPLILEVLRKPLVTDLAKSLNGHIPAINLVYKKTETVEYPFNVRVKLTYLQSGVYSASQNVSELANPVAASKMQFLSPTQTEDDFLNNEYLRCPPSTQQGLFFLINGLVWTVPEKPLTFVELSELL